MTTEEALKTLKEQIDERGEMYFGTDGDREIGKAAVEALEKQIPKKPVLKLHENRVPGEQEEYYCPNCGEWVSWDFEWEWCAMCGQHLDWSKGQ